MKRVVNILIVACFGAVLIQAPMVSAGDEPPESIVLGYLQDLYEPVVFDHLNHGDMYECATCHHHTTGDRSKEPKCLKCHADSPPSPDVSCSGCHQLQRYSFSHTPEKGNNVYHLDKPGLNGALHLQCLGCHRDESGPTGCTECHGFTAAGRKRFAVRNEQSAKK